MMPLKLRIALIIFAIAVTILTTIVLKKDRIPLKYSLLWYLAALIILILAICPFIIEFFTDLLGFATVSNLLIGILISILMFLTMSLTIITSGQKKKITLLIQEVSILKEKMNEKK